MTKPVKIELHPGHWKLPGSGANGIINEVTEARKVTKRVYEILKDSKVPVTYFEDNTSSNQQQNINTLIKHHNADRNGLVVSIHFNASSGTTDKGIGTEVLYYDQEQLAEKVAKAISEASGLINRGAKKRTDLGVLASTYEPAILIEVCFVNSSVDVALYRRDFEKICRAIATELATYIGKSLKGSEEEMQFSSGTLKVTVNDLIGDEQKQKAIIKKAVDAGIINKSWLTDKRSEHDILGICALYALAK